MNTLLKRSVFLCTTSLLLSSALFAQATSISSTHTKYNHNNTANKKGQSSVRLVLVRK